MAEAVVGVALETSRDLLFQEGKFLFGVRDQVVELEGELEMLQSFLKVANERKHEDERLRTCVSQAKRLAYRAEDIIEEYVIKVASKRGGGFRKVVRRVACIVGEGTAIHKVGNEIGKIKIDIANLIKRLEVYGINRIIEAQPSSATIDKQRRLRTTYANEVNEYFVGMQDDVSKIVTWVTEDNKIRHVISICGIGGLGKTTIAKKVFNHFKENSERSFECFAWVSVTQQCQVKMLLQDILIQIMGDKIRDLEEEELVRKLYDVLKNKKSFIVLDDIWKLDDFESLRPAFPVFESSSKILLTTRIREVAEIAHRHSQHLPTLLDDEDGWDLLTKIAFNQQEDQSSKLLEIVELVGRDMLRKCGGLPLAIVALGGILKNKDSLIEWEMVNKKFGTYLRGNGGIMNVLALSYDDLPSYLKPCFLYMGCFREDEEIDVTRLYQLWIAEGLIPSCKQGPEETLMDVASGFLNELNSRNMVQLQVRNVLTIENSCRLHDLVRELCVTKGKEEQFLEVNQLEDAEAWVVRCDGADLCRQAILADTKVKCIILETNDTYYRGLIFNHLGYLFVQGAMKFKRLRSLILDHCEFKDNKLPREIRDMIHLRYLSLRMCLNHGKLPAFIGDLQYIQTLDVSNLGLQLPNIFHKMKRLKWLYLPYLRQQSMSAKRLEFHGLNELEVLENLNSKYDEFTHLSELVNLRRFSATIWGYGNLSTILVLLSSLLKLQYIFITFKTEDPESELEKSFPDVRKLLLCHCLHNLNLQAPIGKFLIYEPQFWPNLVLLELYKTKFEEDPMPFLQELPNLRKLDLWDYAYVGKEMYCSSKAFPKLTSLIIQCLPSIEKWRVDAGAFPNLSTLQISDCESFEIVPDGLTRITSLIRINMANMPEEFRNKYGRLPNTNN